MTFYKFSALGGHDSRYACNNNNTLNIFPDDSCVTDHYFPGSENSSCHKAIKATHKSEDFYQNAKRITLMVADMIWNYLNQGIVFVSYCCWFLTCSGGCGRSVKREEIHFYMTTFLSV